MKKVPWGQKKKEEEKYLGEGAEQRSVDGWWML